MRKEKEPSRKVIYSPKCSQKEWQRRAAREAVDRFLATPEVPRELLLSSLQQAMGKERRKLKPEKSMIASAM